MAQRTRRLPPKEETAGSSPASGTYSEILTYSCEKLQHHATTLDAMRSQNDEEAGTRMALRDNDSCSYGRRARGVHAQESLPYL